MAGRFDAARLRRSAAYAVAALATVAAVGVPASPGAATPANVRSNPSCTRAPIITPPAPDTAIVGQSVTVAVHPPPTGPTPRGYLYQLNAGPPSTVTATAGTASITVVPRRFTNTLTVTGLSPGGTIGESATITFTAAPAPLAADGDLNGDGLVDLVTVGGTHDLPSGLWLAAGDGTGQFPAAATNVGVYGLGVSATSGPADFDGTQVLTGRFTGTGVQDFLVYFPRGERAGGGAVLRGNGDDSPIETHLSGTTVNIWSGALSDINNLNPTQLANAGHSSGLGGAYPDLIAITGDDTVGYYLNYYANQGGTLNYQFPAQLSTPTPTGGTDWNTWTITTAQTPSGTAMFLWQPASGKLYLWNDLGFDVDTATFTYTQHALSGSWNTGQNVTPHGGDINGDGTADLWAIADNATATAWLVADLAAGSGTITAQPSTEIATGA